MSCAITLIAYAFQLFPNSWWAVDALFFVYRGIIAYVNRIESTIKLKKFGKILLIILIAFDFGKHTIEIISILEYIV